MKCVVKFELNPTEEVIVKVFAVHIGLARSGGAVFLFSQLTPIWVDAWQDNNSGIIDELKTGERHHVRNIFEIFGCIWSHFLW